MYEEKFVLLFTLTMEQLKQVRFEIELRLIFTGACIIYIYVRIFTYFLCLLVFLFKLYK